MTHSGRLGVFGGTFDPIHFGHLDAVAAAARQLDLDRVLFVPSHVPPHRPSDPRATAFHRFALVSLAIGGQPAYRASDLELGRTGPSYTIDTIRALHADGWAASQIFFIIGTDAFAEIAQWHQREQVLDGTNFAVVGRTGTTLEAAVDRTPSLRRRIAASGVQAGPSGRTGVYLVEAATRDISSTTVRERLTAGLSIGDLVPEAVARHIIRHGLYGAVDELHNETQGSSGGR